jgi:Pretoxin HINT domain/zinc-ribbon domain
MATCKYCGEKVSPNAKACPHCGEPDPCFPRDVKILTPTGFRTIDTFAAGDFVLSWNMSARTLVARPVTRLLSHGPARIWTIEFASTRPPLRTTNHHAMLTDRGWVRVDRLRNDDRLVEGLASRHQNTRVVRISKTAEKEPVFNLITAGEHNFIVEGMIAYNFTFLRTVRTLMHRTFVDSIATIPQLAAAG